MSYREELLEGIRYYSKGNITMSEKSTFKKLEMVNDICFNYARGISMQDTVKYMSDNRTSKYTKEYVRWAVPYIYQTLMNNHVEFGFYKEN